MGGKKEAITITNDKGRLTEEQIEKMIQEAEQFADEDKKTKERIDAKNAFDNYLHSMTSAAEGSLKEKLDDEEKEVESVCAPIVGKHYGSSAGGDDDEDEDDDE